tara:strand:- start:1902 stop:2147 length:246 start_codon:yes stop_codon:yes gene_type:complete
MGALFGGGRSQPAQERKVEDPRPMPDPASPALRRADVQERGEISRRSGRVSTDLTSRQRSRGIAKAMFNNRPMAPSVLGSI